MSMREQITCLALALTLALAPSAADAQMRAFRSAPSPRAAQRLSAPTRQWYENVKPLRPFRVAAPRYHSKPIMRQQTADGRTVTINGIVYDGYEYTASSFDVASSIEFNTLDYMNDYEASGCAVYANGKMYVNSLRTGLLETTTMQRVFDCSDWSQLDKREISCTASATAMTYDASTNTIYGQFYNDDMSEIEWGWFDPHTARSTTVCKMDERLYALAAAADGTIYAINENGLLETIDPKTGSITNQIGNTGITPKYIQSATIDPKTGKMYWCGMEADGYSALYDVNLTTGEATKIADFEDGEEIVGAYVVYKADDGAPAGVTDLAFAFEGNSLNGSIKFHTPSTTADGNPLTGTLKVKVVINSEVKTVDAQPGQDCSVDVTVPESGWYTVKVSTSNADGESVQTIAEKWIGLDKPEAPSNVKLVNKSGRACLTWDAPKKGQNGGYIDPSKLSYTVFRMPGTVYVAQDYKQTEFSEDISDNEVSNISYYVIPYYEGERGETASSNSVVFGSSFDMPATIDLWNITDFAMCTIEDANNDSCTWAWLGGAKYNGNDDNAADDWLITPSFRLQTGKFYNVVYSVSASNGQFWPERYDIMMGKGNESQVLTMPVVKDETVNYIYVNDKYVEKSVRIKVDEAGNYNFGIHATSDAGNHTLMFSTFGVTEGPVFTAPEAAGDLKAVAAERGELKATLTFTLPTKDVLGNALPSIGKTEIMRGDSVIATLDGKRPGEAVSYVDADVRQGDNTYKVVCYDAEGNAGDAVSTSVYVGVDRPGVATDFTVSYADGTAHLAWTAPTTGSNGGYIDPSKVSYIITEGLYDEIVAQDLNATSYDVPIVLDKGNQEILGYGLYGQNVAGYSPRATSNYLMIGDDYTLPFNEQFTNGLMNYNMWLTDDNSGDNTWDMEKSDGAGTLGCPKFSGGYGEYAMLSTGMIALGNAEKPVLSFWTKSTSSKDKLEVRVTTDYGVPYETIHTVDFSQLTAGEWHKVVLSLDQFKNTKHILIGFKAFANDTYSTINFDDVVVRDQKAHDLTATSIESDLDKVELGKTAASISVGVANNGTEDVAASDYTVKLYNNSKLIDTAVGKAIAAGASDTVSLKYTPQSDDPIDNQIYAVVDYAADENTADNQTKTVGVKMVKPEMPVVNDLKLNTADGANSLSWTKPDLSGSASRIVTDDFESYDAFTLWDMGDWTLYDKDGYNVCCIQGTSYPNMYEPMAFQVFNPNKVTTTTDGLSEIFDPHSGSQYLIDFAAEDGANDDWLVSPELSGNAQTISFYAKSVTNQYGLEQFEVYASEDGTETYEMTRVMDEAMAPVKWTKYTVDLPEGTKYFAIRCVSDMRFAFMLDDITYESAPKPLEVEFLGYNVYRDGKKLNTDPLTMSDFTDNNPTVGATYYVTVVYNVGESDASNIVGGTPTGIIEVGADAIGNADTYTIGGIKTDESAGKGVYIRGGKKFVKK